MEENNLNTSLNLDQEDLEELRRLKKEREAKAKVENIRKEYAKDEARKAIWEAGLGEKLNSNPDIINNESYLNDMVALYMEKAKESLTKQDNQSKPNGQPMNLNKPPIDQTPEPTSDQGENETKLDLKNDSIEDLIKKGASFTDAVLGKAAARYAKN